MSTEQSAPITASQVRDLHWTDLGLQEWERSRFSGRTRRVKTYSGFGDPIVYTWHAPAYDAYDHDDGHRIRPMIQELPDATNADPMTITADDYPEQATTSGPLMLGPEPEPETVGSPPR